MNLTIDVGNTRVKVAVFDDEILVFSEDYDYFNAAICKSIIDSFNIDSAILCCVGDVSFEVLFVLKGLPKFIHLNHETPIPIVNAYTTPKTLGLDRLVAVIGAYSLKRNMPLLVIDAGTAITYDFLEIKDGVPTYLGGNISPGMRIRFKSLNDYTCKLPLIEFEQAYNAKVDLIGTNTNHAIINGVINGMTAEIDSYIAEMSTKYQKFSVFLTGGDAKYFVKRLKSRIFVVQNLMHLGLNYILNYNV